GKNTMRGIVSGDFNGDGKADLAACGWEANGLRVYLGDGRGQFAVGGDFAAGSAPEQMIAADLNGDGLLDLATANSSGGDVGVLIGDGTGHFAAPVHYVANETPVALAS